MSGDNFCILILIAGIVFALFMMNSSSMSEPFENNTPKQDTKNALTSLVDNKTKNVVTTNDKLIDKTVTKINNTNINTNTNTTVNNNNTNTTVKNDSVLKDILKEPENDDNQHNLPVGVSATSTAASVLDNDIDFDILQDVTRNNKTLNSSDLLPQNDDENEFNQYNIPVDYTSADLLANGANKLGINTVGSSKRFASHDLRGPIHCPKFIVGPWNNSTAEPDTNIKRW